MENTQIISIDDGCMESYPCQHYVVLKTNNLIGTKLMYMQEIYELCKKYNYPVPMHIESEYKIWNKM